MTGDGHLDVVSTDRGYDWNGVPDAGAVFIWAGGPTMSGTLDATAYLVDDTGGPNDLFLWHAERFEDVTGDGFVDIVVLAERADIGGAVDAGQVLVWQGGPTLTGEVRPLAKLRAPYARDNTLVGSLGLRIADLDGDGQKDILCPGPRAAHYSATEEVGAAYFWKGGASLDGVVVADTVFAHPDAREMGTNIEIVDVTGDDRLDVVLSAPGTTVDGVNRAGAIFVWAGSSGWAGEPAPTAVLRLDQPGENDELGLEFQRLVDVTGDSVMDIVADCNSRDIDGRIDAGAAYVWNGGQTLVGGKRPSAELVSSEFGRFFSRDTPQHFDDVDGDGLLDLVLGHPWARPGAVSRAGAIGVWRGRPSLAGRVTPWTTLIASDPSNSDLLGGNFDVLDVDSDGTLEIIELTPMADVGGIADAGAIHVWQPAARGGLQTPLVRLVDSSASAGDQLGNGAVFYEDVDADGHADLVTSASLADVGGVFNAGAVFVWSSFLNSSGTAPSTSALTLPQPSERDEMTGDGPL